MTSAAVRTLLAAGLLAGCMPFLGGNRDGRASRTVEGATEWVSSVVASVFREAGIPVMSMEPGAVHSGRFRVEDPWQSARLDTRLACGPDGDLPLYGELVELQVDAYVADESVAEPPGALPPPPGPVTHRPSGRRSRVVLDSHGWLVSGGEARCTLREEFAESILDRVEARTGRRDRVADGAGPIRR